MAAAHRNVAAKVLSLLWNLIPGRPSGVCAVIAAAIVSSNSPDASFLISNQRAEGLRARPVRSDRPKSRFML